MIQATKIKELKGIGEKTEKLFQKIGVDTVGDLIRYYPRGYDVYEEAAPISDIEEGRIMTVTGAIYGKVQVSGTPRLPIYKLRVTDLYRDVEGDLVSYAIPYKYTCRRSKSSRFQSRIVILRERDRFGPPSDFFLFC